MSKYFLLHYIFIWLGISTFDLPSSNYRITYVEKIVRTVRQKTCVLSTSPLMQLARLYVTCKLQSVCLRTSCPMTCVQNKGCIWAEILQTNNCRILSESGEKKTKVSTPFRVGKEGNGWQQLKPAHFLYSPPFTCYRKRKSKILLHQRKLQQLLIMHLIILFQKGKLSFMTFLHIWRQYCVSTWQDAGFIRCHRQFQLTLMGWSKAPEHFKGCEC